MSAHKVCMGDWTVTSVWRVRSRVGTTVTGSPDSARVVDQILHQTAARVGGQDQ